MELGFKSGQGGKSALTQPEIPNNRAMIVPPLVYHTCRVLLGLIFVIACIDKIARPADFAKAVYDYHLLIGPLAIFIAPMAVILPFLELVTGVLLLINRLVRPASLIILGMNIMFIIAIGSAVARGMEIDCGCGLDISFLDSLAGTQADIHGLVRDFVFLAMNLIVLVSPQSESRVK